MARWRGIFVSAIAPPSVLRATASTRSCPSPPLSLTACSSSRTAQLAWLLGQTVPVLTNRCPRACRREGGLRALPVNCSALHSSSVTLSLVVMQWLGVSAAVIGRSCSSRVTLILQPKAYRPAGRARCSLLMVTANQRLWVVRETAYATCTVETGGSEQHRSMPRHSGQTTRCPR